MREAVVGEKIDQFELVDLLARSGMASVFKARDGISGETVALKIPHPQLESDVVFFGRFKRETELGKKLNHPNIVRILTPPKQSRLYLAMEYIAGQSLRALIQAEAPMPPARALQLGCQIADALVYMHERKIVHRDLKPENVLVLADGTVKILDFGIALDESARRLTWAGLSTTLGTPDYMAPEQIGGRRGDARTDVYSLGTLLYEMLTGALPYTAANAQAYIRAKANDDPRPPSYYVPGFDAHLEAIVLKAIERTPRDRYASAAELLADLRDPSQVPTRDAATGVARRRRRRLIPSGLGMPLAVAGILAGLASLVWLSHLNAKHRPPIPSADTDLVAPNR